MKHLSKNNWLNVQNLFIYCYIYSRMQSMMVAQQSLKEIGNNLKNWLNQIIMNKLKNIVIKELMF